MGGEIISLNCCKTPPASPLRSFQNDNAHSPGGPFRQPQGSLRVASGWLRGAYRLATRWPEQRLLTLLISPRGRESITGTIRFTDLKLKWFGFGAVWGRSSYRQSSRGISARPSELDARPRSLRGPAARDASARVVGGSVGTAGPRGESITCLVPRVQLKKQAPMQPKSKTDYYQTHLTFPQKDLWEKFPPAQRVRCRELIVQLLRAVVLTPAQPIEAP